MCLAVPGRIVSIDESDAERRMARIDFGGILRAVSLAFLPEAQVGDAVIVHAGLALSLVDEAEADAALAAFSALERGQ